MLPLTFTKREILDAMNKSKDTNLTINYIIKKFNICASAGDIDDECLIRLKRDIASLRVKVTEKYKASKRMKCRYELKNAEWLNSEFKIHSSISKALEQKFVNNLSPGRPSLSFQDMSERSQRREAAVVSA